MRRLVRHRRRRPRRRRRRRWLLLEAAARRRSQRAPRRRRSRPGPALHGVVADGRVVPVQLAELTAGVPGEVTEVLVAEGDAVTSGQSCVSCD